MRYLAVRYKKEVQVNFFSKVLTLHAEHFSTIFNNFMKGEDDEKFSKEIFIGDYSSISC